MRVASVPSRGVPAVVASLGLLAAALPLTAQPPDVEPRPEHEFFKQWAGTWDATVKPKVGKPKGTLVAKVGLHGVWLIERFKIDRDGMPFEGMSVTSYDAATKKYASVWFHSNSTSPTLSEGTYDPAKKTLTLTGKMLAPDGLKVDVTMTTVDKDAETRDFTLTAMIGDKAVELTQVTYKRRK